MNRFRTQTGIFFLVGVICAGVSAYFFWSLTAFYDDIAYFGLTRETVLLRDDLSPIVYGLRFTTIKFLLLGLAAWLVSILFFIVGKKVRREK